jgi:hypothetical protein
MKDRAAREAEVLEDLEWLRVNRPQKYEKLMVRLAHYAALGRSRKAVR